MTRDQLVSAWGAAPFAEVAWLDPDGRPDAATVVPLMRRGRPALALTYDRLDLARSLATADAVLFSVSAPTLNGGATPVTAWAHVSLNEDREGIEYEEAFMLQELAKYPPSRRLADSILLRSEHRWYLPRLIVRAEQPEDVATHPLRDALVVSAATGGARASTVDLDGDGADVRLTSPVPDGPAVVLQHGADLPDLDRPWWRRWRGEIHDGAMRTDDFVERVQVTRPHGIWRRWRDEVAFERACKAGLRRAQMEDPSWR